MATEGQRAARTAFDAARPSFDRLTTSGDPRETADALVSAWEGTERALSALAGTTALSGVTLVRELRQRSLLALDDAHAFVDFHAAAERARDATYSPATSDLDAARAALDRMQRVLARDVAAYDAPTTSYSGPISTPPGPRATIHPGPAPDPIVVPPAKTNRLAMVVVAVSVAAVLAAGGYYARSLAGDPDALRTARAAFAAGDRLTARNSFAAAASEHPTLAEPHIYLGRMAREEGNLAAASSELRRAVELEPKNWLAHRELAAFLLSTGQAELARTFYQRAIEINPADKVSLGYMGCALQRLGRADLAARFYQRAGPGEWLACEAQPMPAVPPAAPQR